MEFLILGPLEVRAGSGVVELGGVKPRAVLAVLALHANESVSAERLAVALWGEDVPPSAVKTIQVYVARLRKALDDPDVLVTTPAGYRLRVRPGELDAECFEQRVVSGREALSAGRNKEAAAELREALELWRGPPLAELAWAPFAPAEIARLEEQRLAGLEVRIEADLAAGRHAELVGELQRLTSEHPWRERLHAQLMLALYRGGRQADALGAYRHAREVLVEQLGIEPGAELNDLHEAILAHAPAIAAPTEAPSTPGGSRLPAPPNRTIGRAHELEAIRTRLHTASVRLLTLTGPGGVGKTRLAVETARSVEADFADGAYFVSLAALQRSEDVPAAIGRALGVIAISGESTEQAVARFLAGKHLLLVVDNCEHVLSAAPYIGGLLGSCPAVTVLATSREPLALQAEERQPVPPLALPVGGKSQDGMPPDEDAVALFAERARAHDPEFELSNGNEAAVAEICRRVDGLPLAIELAAARCDLLSPAEIAQRLETALGGSLGSGARDAPARQKTLHATIDWSHDLLSEDEKACFARFTVFAGGAAVETAEAITGASLDTLDRLVAKSLLVRRRQPGGETRLAMLETIRAYAQERLGAVADTVAVRERHCCHFVAFAQCHAAERAIWGKSRKDHLARLDADVDNLDRALRWTVSQPDAKSALALCAALGSYWIMRDRYKDAVDWIDRALALPRADAYPALRVRVLCNKSWALWPLGRGDELAAVFAEAEALAQATVDPLLRWHVFQARSAGELDAGRRDVADALADEALHWAHIARDDWAIAMAAFAKAMAAKGAVELRERVHLAASLLEAAGNIYHLAGLLASAAYAALEKGDDPDATNFIRRATPITQELDNPYMWMLLSGNAGLTALLSGNTDDAREAFDEELRLSRVPVALPFASEALTGLAALAIVGDDLDRAARLFGAAGIHRGADRETSLDARLRMTYFEPARSRHGRDAWDAGVGDGAALSFENAIAYALGESLTDGEPQGSA